MNIKTMINDTLRDLDEGHKKLSMIINRTIRIANLLDDTKNLIWLKREMVDSTNTKESNAFRDEVGKMLNNCEDYSKEEYQKDVEEYFARRTVKTIENKKVKDITYGQSLPQLENDIEIVKQKIERNQVPENIHKLDAYYENKSKQEIDSIYFQMLEGYRDIIEKVKVKVYNYLVELETEVKQDNDKVTLDTKNIFIIHGHNEAKWRELEKMIKDDFGLNPIILNEKPDRGKTIIEKFEQYAESCSYAFAIFTPDDVIEKNGEKYFQARPNVIFELGWFCSFLGRRRVCILFQEGEKMNIFSDFQGVIQKRFYNSISEVFRDIKLELEDVGII